MLHSDIRSLPLLARGKVRDVYAVGADRLLMVATDRLSAFDVVMGEPIPGKGQMLTQMSLLWFKRLAHVVPNHLTGDTPQSVVQPQERAQVDGRAMLVKRLRAIPIEAVVRGYLVGSGWKEYQATGAVCGIQLPLGLKLAQKLDTPIFTPAHKAAVGEHDENIGFEQAARQIGQGLAQRIRSISLDLYTQAAAFAAERGIVIADTKFEFGLDADGTLTLMDEVLTPDSSRFWPASGWQPGELPPSYDKQAVREWLELPREDGSVWDKRPPAPSLPAKVIDDLHWRYRQALRSLS
jgi:phosphoribosylaminoimidazole-succinocarboxamide synthase